MWVRLLDLYRELCAEEGCPPLAAMEATLSLLPVPPTGEVYLDLSDCAWSVAQRSVGLRVVLAVLLTPSAYVAVGDEDPVTGRDRAAPPSVLRVKVRLPKNADNDTVAGLCAAIPSSRAAPPGGGPAAVLETLDASGCVLVSLRGGRLLRDAARRSGDLLHVFVDGCSVNRGTARQLHEALAQNRRRALVSRTAGAVGGHDAPAAVEERLSTPPPRTVTTAPATPSPLRRTPAHRPSPARSLSPRPPQPFWEALTSRMESFRDPAPRPPANPAMCFCLPGTDGTHAHPKGRA